MIWLALNLTRAGIGDYWDDIDRWVRNVFTEAQLCRLDEIEAIPDRYFNPKPVQKIHQDDRDILSRSLGSFLGWVRANDGLKIVKTEHGDQLSNLAIQHCCTANGARTLYQVWDSILTKEDDLIRVNLLLNRVSPFLDIDSYLPAQGKVVLKIKNAPAVLVRLPAWCQPARVQTSVSGVSRSPAAIERSIYLDQLIPGDQVMITFPLPEETVTRLIGDLPFRLTLRGSNVINIEPRGTAIPFYTHHPRGTLVEKERFIPQWREMIW
jgi:hypothetical protein